MAFRTMSLAMIAGTALSLGLAQSTAGAAEPPDGHEHGAVYTLTNAAAGNGLVVMARDAQGNLRASGVVPTGGLGTGSGLGSQGALAMSENGRALYAANADSD